MNPETAYRPPEAKANNSKETKSVVDQAIEKIQRLGKNRLVRAFAYVAMLPDLARAELKNVETVRSSETEKADLKKNYDYVASMIGKTFADNILNLRSAQTHEDTISFMEEKHEVSATGFEIQGVSSKKISEVMNSLPNLLKYNTDSVRYTDQVVPMSQAYGFDSNAGGTAYQGKIEINKLPGETPEKLFQRTYWHLHHEAAHNADPFFNELLPPAVRMEWAAMMLRQVSDPNTDKSDYVKRINNPNDPQMEKYLKLREQTADDIRACLRGRVIPPDRKFFLENEIFSQTDPGFKCK